MMVINNEKAIFERKIGTGGNTTALITTYKRPEMLEQCIASMVDNAGTDFTIWVWDNEINNVGINASALMADLVETDHFIVIDEDVIRFPKNWLVNFLDAFYDVPFDMQLEDNPDSLKYWGWLGIMPVRDRFTNGAIWPEYIKKTDIVYGKNWRFRVGCKCPGTCAMMHRDTLKKMGGFPRDLSKQFFNLDARISDRIDDLKMFMGLVDDFNIYHACGPYYNRPYEAVWKEKCNGQTIKQAERQYKKLDETLNYDQLL